MNLVLKFAIQLTEDHVTKMNSVLRYYFYELILYLGVCGSVVVKALRY